MTKTEKVFHTLKPEFTKNSRVLILGSMPSPKSRENGFYYGHPQNKFWKVLAGVLECNIPQTNEEKRFFLNKYNIALWDVLAECDIENASDTSIRNPVPNKICDILDNSDIKQVFTTGKKAYDLYNRLCPEAKQYPAISLPSTSPANCRITLDTLISEYSCILDFLRKE